MDMTPVLKAVMSLIAVVITAVVIPYIKSKTTTSQQQEILEWVKIAVAAAEQLYKGSGRGQEKKDYVLAWLSERNIKIDIKELDAMIESSVYELTKKVSQNEENC